MFFSVSFDTSELHSLGSGSREKGLLPQGI
nr:MAG TPA: hypothetical protein [Caudoviricetes sp.]